jgi:hypothetical protein
LGRGQEIGKNAVEVGALRIGKTVHGLLDNVHQTVESYRPPASAQNSPLQKPQNFPVASNGNNQNSGPTVTNLYIPQPVSPSYGFRV